MPLYCAPWPVNTKAMRGGSRLTTRSVASPAAASPPASAARPDRNSSRVRAMIVARCAKCARPAFAVWQIVPKAASAGRDSTAACRAASSASAFASRADTANRQASPEAASCAASIGGASSTITCALVPLKPNELTPAMRRPSIGCQAIGSRGTCSGRSAQGMCGLGVVKCRCGRDGPVLQREHDLDQAGDAGRRLQVADIGLDRADDQRSRRSRSPPNTAPSALTSSGSPSCVPVPCASM